MTLLLRPRNFFERNPALDVRPSRAVVPSEMKKGEEGCGCGERESVQV